MSIFESLNEAKQRATEAEEKRLELVRAVRKQAVSNLERHGKREPNGRLYAAIPILPLALSIFIGHWLGDKINPLDRVTQKKLEERISETGITIRSSEGNPNRSYLVTIEVSGLSKLALSRAPYDIKIVSDTLFSYNPNRKSWEGERRASVEELLLFSRFLDTK